MHSSLALQASSPYMSASKLPLEVAESAKSWLADQGFTSEVLVNIGTFVTLWAAFENRVERVIWSFEGKPAPHTRPSTDGQPLTQWWETLERKAETLGPELRSVLEDFVIAGRDLAAYRHAMLHGWVIPKGVGGPMFMSNARWGELQRKRASQDAHVHPDIAYLAISAAVEAKSGEVIVIDVRPQAEYEQAHLPFARSMPIGELERRLSELPKRRQIVAYCRGPFCMLSDEALKLLRSKGYQVSKILDGVSEWSAAGLPLVKSDSRTTP
jgi:rhodanese-related sulfurtransferase